MNVGHLHPSAELPFLANALRAPSVVYVNPAFGLGSREGIAARFGWLIPGVRDQDGVDPERTQTFGAERYGGGGTGLHGGGARCGNQDGFQVKGIGANPLLGADAPADYSHGGVALFEAVQEAVWGEIAHAALPHGAVRVAAAIATGTRCWWVHDRWHREIEERFGHGAELPRGLIVRPAALRPAHFMRNILHRTANGRVADAKADVLRVRALVEQLDRVLPSPQPLCEDWADAGPAAPLLDGLAELARRLAEQLAAAQARRITHGALSPANLCLDGRWIDFGSTSGLPGWGTLAGQHHDFWEAHGAAYAVLEELFTLSRKFHPARDALAADQLATLLARYDTTYGRALDQEFVALAGFDARTLLTDPSVAALGAVLRTIAKAGHRRPYDLGFPDDRSEFGRYKLRHILFELARLPADDRAGGIAGLLPDATLRARLVSAYARVEQQLRAQAEAAGVGAQPFRRLVTLRALKGTRAIDGFYRSHLVAATEALVMGAPNREDVARAAAELIGTAADQAMFTLGAESGFDTCMWRSRDIAVRYCAVADAWRIERGATTVMRPWGWAPDGSETGRPFAAMQDHWRPGWERL